MKKLFVVKVQNKTIVFTENKATAKFFRDLWDMLDDSHKHKAYVSVGPDHWRYSEN